MKRYTSVPNRRPAWWGREEGTNANSSQLIVSALAPVGGPLCIPIQMKMGYGTEAQNGHVCAGHLAT